MAGWTRLELATFCVTGRRSNQLSYHPVKRERGRNVDSDLGMSSVVWKSSCGIFRKIFQRVFTVGRDPRPQFIQTAELALRPEEMKPFHHQFGAISQRAWLQ
jgi:hypothetical protein